jgi:hypothetical protein
MTECRNPECRNGYSPGVIASGKGSANAPVIGASMRWGWVKCRACNHDPDAPFKHVSRSTAEIGERARLADAKAAYVHQEVAKRGNLEAIKVGSVPPAPTPTNMSDPMVPKLLAQIEKLTDQITTLLEENSRVRRLYEASQEDEQPSEPVVKRVKKKKKVGGNDDTNGAKGRRALS